MIGATDKSDGGMISPRAALLAILLAGLVLRLVALWPLSMHHPDEMIQYAEQAHRLAFGYGVVPWEYRVGMRSWLVPVALSGPMALGGWIAPDTMLHLYLPRLIAVLASMTIIWSGWRLGARQSNLHGLVAAFVMAIWFEQVYFATHLLTEMFATAAFLPAAAILLNKTASSKQLFWAGLLVTLACILRFHYGPAIATFVLLSCYDRIRVVFLPLALGALTMVLISSAVDLFMGQYPLAWIVENFRQNIQLGAAAKFGTDGPLAYLLMLAGYWQIGLVPVLVLMIAGSRDNKILLVTAIVNLVVHSMIGHKEYRFIFLTSTIFVFLAATGSANILQILRGRHPGSWLQSRWGMVMIGALWIGLSLAGAASLQANGQWTNRSELMEIGRKLGDDPSVCGVALHEMQYWELGSYSAMRRNVPHYLYPSGVPARKIAADIADFNIIAAPPADASNIPDSYAKTTCSTAGVLNTIGQSRAICIYKRPGSCAPGKDNANRLDVAIKRAGQ